MPISRRWRTAVDAGEDHVDLHMRLPVQTAQACEVYNQLLDDADEHCRAAHLITLPTDRDCVALRRWVMGETARQAAGLAPQPWRDETAHEDLAVAQPSTPSATD